MNWKIKEPSATSAMILLQTLYRETFIFHRIANSFLFKFHSIFFSISYTNRTASMRAKTQTVFIFSNLLSEKSLVTSSAQNCNGIQLVCLKASDQEAAAWEQSFECVALTNKSCYPHRLASSSLSSFASARPTILLTFFRANFRIKTQMRFAQLFGKATNIYTARTSYIT